MASDRIVSLETFRRFFADDFEEASAEIERTDRIPDVLVRGAAAIGAFRLTLPKAFGGFELLASEYLPYLEAAAMGPTAGRMLVHTTNGLWRPLAGFGSAEQRVLIPGVGSGDVVMAFALTERNGGTGRDIRSRAAHDGRAWSITGEKHLITFGTTATHVILIAATDERRAKDSLTAFLIPMDTPGLRKRDQFTMGCRGTGHVFLEYEDMRVDDNTRLGEVGQGLEVALTFLDYSRLSLSTCMVGLAERAIQESVRFSLRRKTFGVPIADRQAIQVHLAEMRAAVDPGRAIVREVASRLDGGSDITVSAAAAKLYCLNMVGNVTDHALRVHGGFGYTKDAAIERIYRDARAYWFEEGTAEVQQFVVARDMIRAERARSSGPTPS